MKSPRSSYPILGRITQKEFLDKYWQKKPVLLKGALVPFPDIITPEEVAGMACDERIESRLILEKGGKTPWEMRRGPFKPASFKKLPTTNWTVLVNGVDRFIPGVHELLDQFSFVPFWRMDDVMVSYAADKGNVGAHVDNFDVFLVQASGKRKWMIEDRAVLEDDFVPGLPVRLLKKFKATRTWVLEAGDILYLPPRFPHHGIAQGKGCMTISVGFRAPNHAEIVNGVVSAALSSLDDRARFTDKGLKPQHPGEISKSAIESIQKIVRDALSAPNLAAEWLGRYVTETYDDVTFTPPEQPVTKKALAQLGKLDALLVRAEGAKLAFVSNGKKSITFYVNGDAQELTGDAADVAKALSAKVVLPYAEILPLVKTDAAKTLLLELLNAGIVLVEEATP